MPFLSRAHAAASAALGLVLRLWILQTSNLLPTRLPSFSAISLSVGTMASRQGDRAPKVKNRAPAAIQVCPLAFPAPTASLLREDTLSDASVLLALPSSASPSRPLDHGRATAP